MLVIRKQDFLKLHSLRDGSDFIANTLTFLHIAPDYQLLNGCHGKVYAASDDPLPRLATIILLDLTSQAQALQDYRAGIRIAIAIALKVLFLRVWRWCPVGDATVWEDRKDLFRTFPVCC